MPKEKTENIEELKKEIEELKKQIQMLQQQTKAECEEKMVNKEKVVEILDETENVIKKTFSLIEGAIIGAIEGAKKNIK